MDRTAERETEVDLDKTHRICRERRIISLAHTKEKTGNVRINVTMRRVRVTIVAVVKQL
jgi:hypothetical protein